MGEKRESIRTLPSGERVRHFPADEDNPDGKMVLITDVSPMRERLEAEREEKSARHAELKKKHAAALAAKQAAMAAGDAVPPEKRFC